MKTLLFGNGFNLLNGYATWKTLVKKIEDKTDSATIPNTLQFEAEVLQLPEHDADLFGFERDVFAYNKKGLQHTPNTEVILKSQIAERMKQYKSNALYSRIASMKNVSHYITTNYDDVLARTLISMGYVETEHIKIENTYSLRRRHSLEKQELQKHIWNIHGEILLPQTIMLGLHQYCGSVGRITEYLSGKYTYSVDKLQNVVDSIRERIEKGIDFPFSWIDLFFISDIVIIGLSLLYEEIDLWWILTRRKRLIRQGFPIQNHIYFCGPVDKGKQKLLETMNVEIINPSPKAESYEEKYNSVLDSLGW